MGSNYSLGLWSCNFEGSEQVSAWNQRTPGPVSAVLGLRFGPFLKSFHLGALNEGKHEVASLFRARVCTNPGLGSSAPTPGFAFLGWRSALTLGLGFRMAALWWR